MSIISRTQLIKAIIHGDVEEATSLISLGDQLEIGDQCGMTPLMYAVCYGQHEIVSALLEHGVSIDRLREQAYHRHWRNL